ncbi:ATP-binding cassette domain-containing protein [Cumulibacter manganitolerans]|uniref:ATP-binding cassette domain-containing protein n=1 Tax=Cumulibacter manganitolerans TaxID=1884992 RepID=UPI0012969794|nr:excinuclease ABC subunit UvrA [Cumulibacter manganitolerans]
MAHAADSHDRIRVRGAHQNNLKSVDVDIPKRRLTVFTGVSGSGKSSLVFGTIAAESRRMIDETYPAFVQGFMPKLARPEVDRMENISPAIIIDQEPMGANSRSTVGTATDAATLLRMLFSRLSEPYVGSPMAFSFNVATASGSGVLKKSDGTREHRTFSVTGGQCPTCEGTGKVSTLDLDQIVDRGKTLNEGAILAPGFGPGTWGWRLYGESEKLDPDKKLAEYTEAEWQWLVHAGPTKVKIGGINLTHEGLIPRIERTFLSKERPPKQAHIKAYVARIATFGVCPDCGGTRLNEAARTATVAGTTIAEASRMQVSELLAWLENLDAPGCATIVAGLRELLRGMTEIGLGYLSLDRESATLSGGESQRVKMVRHLGSALTDISYVFDEPTIGLHPHDITRMITLLEALRDKGNTILVVEHKPDVIERADHIVDLGPGAGANGGEVTYAGPLAGLKDAGTRTGEYLSQKAALKSAVRSPSGALNIEKASTNNLRDVTVDVPLGVLTVITGVAGSGKSSLIHGNLPRDERVSFVDQSPIRGSRRSNPGTYTGVLDHVRKAFAKANGVKESLFSANSDGACPECKGLGLVFTEPVIPGDTGRTCEVCEGRRFADEVLEYTLHGRTIVDVLDMSIEDAAALFTAKTIATMLGRLVDVGLGYLKLGQPLNTLSGGERQRLKLAIAMAEPASVFVLDEPTSGLHLADVDRILALLDKLVDDGGSVIVIEHNRAVMAHADWIIDIGPGAGHDGGTVVFEGTPSEMVALRGRKQTLTGKALADYVAR